MNHRSTDTLPLHVESRGSGPPVMFLHGFGAHSFTFRHWAGSLAGDHRVALVDLKGFGDAPKPADGAYGPDDQADLVTRLIREGDMGDLTLVGHSLGGGVALLAALRLLDAGELGRLRGIVSVAGPAYPQDFPTYVSLARRRWLALALLRFLPTRWLIRTVLRSIVHDPGVVTDEQVEAYAAPLRTPEGRRALVETAVRILPPDIDDIVARYPEIDVPTLLLWGRSDPVVPLWVAERLARDLPRAELAVVDGCGHDPPEERPDETAALVREFITRSAPAPPPRPRST